jgi:hypothetical protein
MGRGDDRERGLEDTRRLLSGRELQLDVCDYD